MRVCLCVCTFMRGGSYVLDALPAKVREIMAQLIAVRDAIQRTRHRPRRCTAQHSAPFKNAPCAMAHCAARGVGTAMLRLRRSKLRYSPSAMPHARYRLACSARVLPAVAWYPSARVRVTARGEEPSRRSAGCNAGSFGCSRRGGAPVACRSAPHVKYVGIGIDRFSASALRKRRAEESGRLRRSHMSPLRSAPVSQRHTTTARQAWCP